MNLENFLLNFGLNGTEIKIYKTILHSPNIKVSDIQKNTELVRTTLYHNLSLLKSRGLISESKINNVSVYSTTGSDALKTELNDRINDDKALLQNLTAIENLINEEHSNSLTDSYIERFEGINAVKQSIEKAFRCDKKNWLIIAPIDNFLLGCSKQYQQYYLNEKRRRKIRSHTLWDPAKQIEGTSLQDLFFRAPKKLPVDYKDQFKSLYIIYDDTTLIIDSYKQKTAHAIVNEDATKLNRLMFETIWGIAEDY